MKKSILLLLLSIAAIGNAQDKINGNGNVIQKTQTTADYDKISVAGFFDVDLISGNEGKITIEGEENLLQYVTLDVNNGTLKISVEKGKRISPSHGKTIRVTVPFESLNEVSLTGSGDVTSKNTIKSSRFEASLSGSGDMKLTVDASEIRSQVTGSGDMALKGKSGELHCEVAGSGDLDASTLESGSVNCSVAGSGNCKVYCTDALYARVIGSGDINYKGNPKKKDTKVTGSGSISKT